MVVVVESASASTTSAQYSSFVYFFPIQGGGHSCGIPTVLMMVLGSGVTFACNLKAVDVGLSGKRQFQRFIACI